MVCACVHACACVRVPVCVCVCACVCVCVLSWCSRAKSLICAARELMTVGMHVHLTCEPLLSSLLLWEEDYVYMYTLCHNLHSNLQFCTACELHVHGAWMYRLRAHFCISSEQIKQSKHTLFLFFTAWNLEGCASVFWSFVKMIVPPCHWLNVLFYAKSIAVILYVTDLLELKLVYVITL